MPLTTDSEASTTEAVMLAFSSGNTGLGNRTMTIPVGLVLCSFYFLSPLLLFSRVVDLTAGSTLRAHQYLAISLYSGR
jgi:hypothetical protein